MRTVIIFRRERKHRDKPPRPRGRIGQQFHDFANGFHSLDGDEHRHGPVLFCDGQPLFPLPPVRPPALSTAFTSKANSCIYDDRRFFLATLAEACDMTGWRVHAGVLMGNHCHLYFQEFPFQSTNFGSYLRALPVAASR